MDQGDWIRWRRWAQLDKYEERICVSTEGLFGALWGSLWPNLPQLPDLLPDQQHRLDSMEILVI